MVAGEHSLSAILLMGRTARDFGRTSNRGITGGTEIDRIRAVPVIVVVPTRPRFLGAGRTHWAADFGEDCVAVWRVPNRPDEHTEFAARLPHNQVAQERLALVGSRGGEGRLQNTSLFALLST